MVDTQTVVEIATTVIFFLSAALAFVLTAKFAKRKSPSLLFWSIGIWLFALTTFFEILFAFNYYSTILAKLYFFLVGVLVLSLSLGSIQLVKRKRIKNIYYLFSIASTMFLIYSLAVTDFGNILLNYVAAANPPDLVIDASSVMVFPAAAVLVVVAYNSYRARKDKRMLSIILGVIIVSIAGTLYIASFPAFLYISEFVGILLLWYGFI